MAECRQCGKCCIATHPKELIGGSRKNDRWLRKSVGYSGRSAECRYLLPRDGNGHRLCAIYDNPVRPEFCAEAPACLPDDVVKMLIKHSGSRDCPLLLAEAKKRFDEPAKRVEPN